MQGMMSLPLRSRSPFFSVHSHFFLTFFRLLSVLRGHSFFSSTQQQPMTSDFEGFLYQIFSITLFPYLNS